MLAYFNPACLQNVDMVVFFLVTAVKFAWRKTGEEVEGTFTNRADTRFLP